MATKFRNYAVFGQATYSFTDTLRLIAGARFTEDQVSFSHNRTNPTGVSGPGIRADDTDFDGQETESDISGKIGLEWDLGGNLLYGTASQGYKGPAFDVFFNMNENQTVPVSSETSDSYEIGYKIALDNAVINLAAFTAEYEDFQANNFDVIGGAVVARLTNAGRVETSGLEVDFIWQATDNFSLSGGAAFINAEIDEFNCPVDPNTGLPTLNCTSRSGLDVPFAPDTKFSLAGQYSWPLGDGNEVILNASYSYTDEQTSTLPANDGTVDPDAVIPDYGILNGTVGFSFDDDRYRITLIAKNLTDESYYATFSGGGQPGPRYQIPRLADRHFGISFRASFGR